MTGGPRGDWLAADELAPAAGGVLAPLYEAASRGALAMPFCPGCGRVLELEQVVCDTCGAGGAGGPAWRSVELAGTVHAVTTVHRLEPGLVRAEAPYQVADVELTSGHRVVMTTEEPGAAPLAVGDRVRVAFRTVGGVALPAVAGDRPAPLADTTPGGGRPSHHDTTDKEGHR
jgi:uncharacterized protein